MIEDRNASRPARRSPGTLSATGAIEPRAGFPSGWTCGLAASARQLVGAPDIDHPKSTPAGRLSLITLVCGIDRCHT
jgi:hypothetical protein